MIRATTPIYTFIFDEDPSIYEKILITFAQGDSVVLEKTKEDLTIERISHNEDPYLIGKFIAYFRMSQEETKLFKANVGKPVVVQVRVLTFAGEALASEKKRIFIQDVLNDEVLS